MSASSWFKVQELTAADAAANDGFGRTISVSGDYAIVGAPDDDDHGLSSGSAYIYKRSGSTWSQQQKLDAWDAEADDKFGWSVSLSGNYAIVGAPESDDSGSSSGSAYIFQLSGSTWYYQQKLVASDGAQLNDFGSSVAISSDGYAIVGAYCNNGNGIAICSGAAYIFKLSGSTWSQHQKLVASDVASFAYFGRSVSISSTGYAIVGASNGNAGSGSAYIFKLSISTWSEQQKLVASDAVSGDLFGTSVSVSGGYAIVGAPGNDDSGSGSGSAYIYELSGSVWVMTKYLVASDAKSGDNFGSSVAISNNGYAFTTGSWVNIVYIYQRSGSSWIEQQKLPSYHKSLAISGDYALCGADVYYLSPNAPPPPSSPPPPLSSPPPPPSSSPAASYRTAYVVLVSMFGIFFFN